MSDADEIGKLADLKQKGILTEAEFESKKRDVLNRSAKPKKRFPWWLRITLAIVGLIGLISALSNLGSQAGFPMCDSSDANEVVKNAIEQNASSNVNTLKLLGLNDIKEMSYDDKKPERMCQATALLNSGQQKIHFRLFKSGENFLGEVTPD